VSRRRSIEVRTIPSADVDFHTDVRQALDASIATLEVTSAALADTRSLLESLGTLLRPRYPNVVVHLRDRFAALAEAEPDVVYAYRDGERVA
jgi:hypothetical protein